MINNLIIIIPTHNRQHYLKRVVKYYSSFPCNVYICDSSKEAAELDCSDNILYRWVPQSNFYGKVLDVLNETAADFYALSPDDDFLKQETLIECYEEMSSNPIISLGTGRQVFFDKPFDGSFYLRSGANNLSGFRRGDGEKTVDYIRQFWCHYQNILWSLFKREAINNAFKTLSACNFKNGNFIEIILGIESLRVGDVYVSCNGFNYREFSRDEHWGVIEIPINTYNINLNDNLKKDVSIFYSFYKEDNFAIYNFESNLNTEMERKRNRNVLWYVKLLLPIKAKKILKVALAHLRVKKSDKVCDNLMSERILIAMSSY